MLLLLLAVVLVVLVALVVLVVLRMAQSTSTLSVCARLLFNVVVVVVVLSFALCVVELPRLGTVSVLLKVRQGKL